jgi:hypothetical protein
MQVKCILKWLIVLDATNIEWKDESVVPQEHLFPVADLQVGDRVYVHARTYDPMIYEVTVAGACPQVRTLGMLCWLFGVFYEITGDNRPPDLGKIGAGCWLLLLSTAGAYPSLPQFFVERVEVYRKRVVIYSASTA